MKKTLNTVFLIAGSEPLGSAGMQADIKAITACGGYAACAVTSIVDEDTRRIKNIFHMPTELIVSQAESFLGDIETGCIKTGVLPSEEIIRGVAGVLRRFKHILGVNGIAAFGHVHKHVSKRSCKSAVLQNRTARHTLNNTAGNL